MIVTEFAKNRWKGFNFGRPKIFITCFLILFGKKFIHFTNLNIKKIVYSIKVTIIQRFHIHSSKTFEILQLSQSLLDRGTKS